MKTLSSKWMTVLLTAAVLTPVSVTQASGAGDFYRILEYMGFQLYGTQNILRDNLGVHLDGVWVNPDNPNIYSTIGYVVGDLQLRGTIRSAFGPSFRGIPSLQYNINTTNSFLSPNTPLDYILNTPVGLGRYETDGSFLVDIDGNINALGYYDFTTQISNRGTRTEIPFEGDPIPTDFDDDFGPLRFEGNILARILQTTTDPLFNRLGIDNPFARFQTVTAVNGLTVKNDAALASRVLTGDMEALPEPATAMLMLGGLLVIRRPRRR